MEKRYPRTIMATACIPWDEKLGFVEELFRREVRMLVGSGIKSIYLFGTAGEGYAVDDRMFERIVTVFYDEMQAPGLMPMVGIISLSLPEIIWRIELCREQGIRDFQISFPSWGKLSDKEIDNFFIAVLLRFPDCRFMHYNNGIRTGRLLSVADYERLWPRYPNLAAVKFPGMGDATALSAGNELRYFPLENGFAKMSVAGDCGLLISLLNMSYETAWEYFEAGVRGDAKTIGRITSDIAKIWEVFRSTLPQDAIDGAYDKLFVSMAIPEFPYRLYPPYEGVTDGQFEAFSQGVRRALPHWKFSREDG